MTSIESEIGWGNCSSSTREQVNNFVASLHTLLADNLIGAYLHGSLAMDCFNIHSSDIDLLFVVQSGLSVEVKREIALITLTQSSNPHALEYSILTLDQLHPWQYPTPYDFHYGEDWRDKIERELQDDTWRTWDDEQKRDADLAAHITITRQLGITLYGRAIEDVFPEVPKPDYWDSLVADFKWLLPQLEANPVYGILNMCRVYYYKAERVVCSKAVGGLWALNVLSSEYHYVIQMALDVYRGILPEIDVHPDDLKQFAAHMSDLILDEDDQ